LRLDGTAAATIVRRLFRRWRERQFASRAIPHRASFHIVRQVRIARIFAFAPHVASHHGVR
jgi:hypothetical protein